MEIILTRLTNDRHRLAIKRLNGLGEERELETKSLLVHDLVHFALESEAKIAYGFWGRLAAGATMASLYDAADPAAGNPPLMEVESLVGPMQSLWLGRMSEAQYLEHAQRIRPDLVDITFIAAVLERMRRIWGQWQATPFGQAMRLEWRAPDNG